MSIHNAEFTEFCHLPTNKRVDPFPQRVQTKKALNGMTILALCLGKGWVGLCTRKEKTDNEYVVPEP